MTHKHPLARWTPTLQHIGLGTLCAAVAFTVGLETAGDVHPFDTSEAAFEQSVVPGRVALRGDLDNDGFLTVADAILLLEFSEGYETATPREIREGDIDGDLQLTTKDVLRLLQTLSSR